MQEMPSMERLGFGTAFLAGGLSAGSSRRLLDAALKAGIKHFDTAPLYGLGLAENVLGEVLAGRRSDLIVATKFGRPRPAAGGALSNLKAVLRPFLKLSPGMRARLSSRMAMATAGKEDYSADAFENSLSDSLKRLKTDYVDFLLLHDIPCDEITEELISCLDKRQKQGAVLRYGIATDFDNAVATTDKWPILAEVVQTSWAPATAGLMKQFPKELILYRVIQNAIAAVKKAAPAARDLQSLSDRVGADLGNQEVIAALSLLLALDDNPNGKVLFSSRKPAHILRCRQILSDENLLQSARKLRSVLPGTG